jgi:hypothetical protein
MTAPPLEDDAEYVTLALLELNQVTAVIVGAVGTPAVVTLLLDPLAALLPHGLCAYTTNVYEVDFDNPLTVMLPDPL